LINLEGVIHSSYIWQTRPHSKINEYELSDFNNKERNFHILKMSLRWAFRWIFYRRKSSYLMLDVSYFHIWVKSQDMDSNCRNCQYWRRTTVSQILVLHIYCYLYLWNVCWTGNSLSFLVMTKPQNRHVSCCIYMSALAISDCLVLHVTLYLWVATDAYQNYQMIQFECSWISTVGSVMHFIMKKVYLKCDC